MSREYNCPHCYKQVNPCELLYFKPSCGDKLPPPALSLLQKMKLAASPSSILCNKNNKSTCKTCNRRLSFRACPICKGTIPTGVDGSPIIIAITGASGTGKSRYIQAVITQLRKLSEIFNWFLIQCDASTNKNTMFILRRSKGDKGKLIVLTEIAESELSPIAMNALSGMIYLIDPLQAEAAREEIQANGITPLPAFTEHDPTHTLKRLAQSNTTLPIAITLAKLDTLIISDAGYTGRWLLNSDERLVCQDSSSLGKINKKEQETIHCEMESWISTAYPGIQAITKKLQKYRFFGCSSIEPALRVEDSLLWLLAQNKGINI